MCPRQELNLYYLLRREALYPFNYEGMMLTVIHYLRAAVNPALIAISAEQTP